MKHVFTSAGVLAFGAISLHAYDPQLTRQTTGRPWSVAAVVRGFYDDNVTTSPDKTLVGGKTVRPQDSFGLEVSPSAHLNLPLEQTFISLGYVYSLRWYEDRDPHDTDQAHEFNGKLRHQIDARQDIGIDDSFVVTSEPTVVDRSAIVTAPIRTRTDSDVMHNNGAIEYNAGLSQQFALSFGYVNSWYDYEQENIRVTPRAPLGSAGTFGSRSALLDRMEHLIRADARYQVNPKLVGLVGYIFQFSDYTGDELITPLLKSDARDSFTHYIYVGGDYDVTAKLRTSLRIGGQFTDYFETHENSANPYADASLTYVYLPGSSVQVGVRHSRSATDVAAADKKGRPTLDAESTSVYGQLNHRITRNLTGSLTAQFQNSEFNDGANDGKSEDFYLVGLNLDYRFNQHFSAEVGYNYDLLDSDIKGTGGLDARSYDRNRVYIGLRASY
jgi:predicted porin